MRWEEHRARQQTRAAEAVGAARALLQGRFQPASDLLGALLPLPDPAWRDRILGLLLARPPRPRPELVRGALFAEVVGEPPALELEPFQLRAWSAERGAPGPVGEVERLAWALDELVFLAEEIARREVDAWGAEAAALPSRALADAEAAVAWSCFFAGGQGAQEAALRWRVRYGEALERPFRVLAARHPEDAPRGDALREALERALLPQLVEDRDGVPGWLDVAIRVLEGAGQGGTVGALAARLDEQSRPRAARCVVRRKGLDRSSALLLPDTPPAWREEILSAQLQDPRALVSFAGAHAARGLIQAWASGRATHPDVGWVVARACRRRHRLRAAVASGEIDAIEQALLALDHLDARTATALSRYAFDWAWEEAHRGFPFGARPLTPRCGDPARRVRGGERAPARGAGARRVRSFNPRQEALRTWVFKVILRGREEALRRWVRPDGGDAQLELAELIEELPERCRPRRRASWDGVRAALFMDLEGHVAALQPQLQRVAAVDLSRPKKRVNAELGALFSPAEGWDPLIPPICKGYARCVEQARQHLARRALARGEEGRP